MGCGLSKSQWTQTPMQLMRSQAKPIEAASGTTCAHLGGLLVFRALGQFWGSHF